MIYLLIPAALIVAALCLLNSVKPSQDSYDQYGDSTLPDDANLFK